MTNEDRRDMVARRSKLWKVLVAGGMALATACAGMQKDSSGSGSGSTGSSGSSGTSGASGGGGASGW